jgi:hypothetical protein
MTYSNDPNRRNGMRNETSYTGWIIGGVVALAVIIAIFAMTNRSGTNSTASNTPAATPTVPATTGAATPNNPPAVKPAVPTNTNR